MKVALPYLYQGKTSGQGVFEETFAEKLGCAGIETKVFYPSNKELRKIPQVGTILSMASLREYKEELNSYDLIYSTNGTCVALMDNEISPQVVPVYHSTGFSIFETLIADKEGVEERETYLKHSSELKNLEMVPRDISAKSLQNWGLCGIFAAQNAENIVAVSENVKQELIEFGGAKQENIKVIENGLENYWFEENINCPECQKLMSGWDQNKTTVMWVGRMGRDELNFKIKGIDRLLEVMSSLDENRFNKVVIAIIPLESKIYAPKYSALFESRGIKFFPNHPYEHLPHLMRHGDIFIMTSRYEGFSLALVEAMASGLAPISYQIGVAPEAIINGTNGYLINNLKEMIDKIYLLSNNSKLLKEISNRAAKTAAARFKIDDMITKYKEYFLNILGN